MRHSISLSHIFIAKECPHINFLSNHVTHHHEPSLDHPSCPQDYESLGDENHEINGVSLDDEDLEENYSLPLSDENVSEESFEDSIEKEIGFHLHDEEAPLLLFHEIMEQQRLIDQMLLPHQQESSHKEEQMISLEEAHEENPKDIIQESYIFEEPICMISPYNEKSSNVSIQSKESPYYDFPFNHEDSVGLKGVLYFSKGNQILNPKVHQYRDNLLQSWRLSRSKGHTICEKVCNHSLEDSFGETSLVENPHEEIFETILDEQSHDPRVVDNQINEDNQGQMNLEHLLNIKDSLEYN